MQEYVGDDQVFGRSSHPRAVEFLASHLAPSRHGWWRMRAHVESGAVDTVGPGHVAQGIELKETAMPRKKPGVLAANSTH